MTKIKMHQILFLQIGNIIPWFQVKNTIFLLIIDLIYQTLYNILKINANTRAITIPTELKMLGIAGDNIAEIVFFEIDRFFDTMDFSLK